MGYKLFNILLLIVMIFWQGDCDPKPNECNSSTLLHDGEFGLCLTNGTEFDLDFFVIGKDGKTVRNGFKGTSTIEAGEIKKESTKILYGESIYYRSPFNENLKGLTTNFSDQLITRDAFIEVKNDSLHFKIKVDSTQKYFSFHFPGHICSPSKPNCDDTQ